MEKQYKITERGKNFLESGLVVDGGFENSRLMQLLAFLNKGKTLEEKVYSPRLLKKAVRDGYIVFAGNEPIKPEFELQKKYVKIGKPLENKIRKLIYDYISQHPGAHFNEMKNELGIKNGAMVHHSRVLLDYKLIESVKDKQFVRYFLPGQSSDIEIIKNIKDCPMREEILKIIRENKGIIQKDLAEKIGVSANNIFYHCNILETNGKIICEKVGLYIRYYIND